MSYLLNRLFWALSRLALSFRYRTRVTGSDQLKTLSGPTLVIPNHPAYIDPPLLSSHLRLHKPVRPLVFSGTYRMLLMRPLMALVNAFEVPDLSSQSRNAQARALEMIDSVVERLHAGDCMLIYPSGRLQRGNTEVVGAARSVYEIVSRCPDINIVMVRTRGVWGSMFSCAELGSPPELSGLVRRAAGWVIASLFFFLPRRDVHIHFEIVDRDSLPLETKEAFNTHLENWYNADGPQEPKFVRYHYLFGPSEGDYEHAADEDDFDVSAIKPKTVALVNELVCSHLGRELTEEEKDPATKLETIGLDSLGRMDLALEIEQQFGFRSDSVVSTIGGLWALADGQVSQNSGSLETPDAWKAPRKCNDELSILADTIGEAFVRRAFRQPDDVAVADRLSGVLSYRRMLVAARLMAKRFSQYDEQHIGVMLPASAAADIVFFALHISGKVPVMMNFTTGPANLAHGVEVTGVKRILTSHKMIDRLGIEVQGADYVYLEDIKADISKLEALSGLLGTVFNKASILRNLPPQKADDTAVFLFTSGSESVPKTVPLTHRNLIVNVGDGQAALNANSQDSLIGFLPPFHSFGMTGNLLLPHLNGIKCVRHADPTDASGLVRIIEAYRPTLIFTTPTFLGYILAACEGDQLTSLRTIVTGAEKCPETVFELCRKMAPQATILEGYGITECSPVVSANGYGRIKAGSVGKPAPNVQVRIVGVETNEPVPTNQTGMLLVSGPSIFQGYYRHDGPSPFVDGDGKQWYKTGDLVSQDEEGYLYFQGRLKRFLKAAGEMISLPALEDPFAKRFPADENGPRVAVEGIETNEGRHIVLFTTEDLSLREAGELLKEAGFRGVMRLDDVRKVDHIPVLGTGKTDYKELRKLVQEMAL